SRRLNEAVCGILARHTRRSPTQLLEVMRHDRFFGAEAARDFGLVDEVLYPRHRNLAAPAPGQDQAPGRSRKRVRGSERGVILPGE
ncbi:MAG TPA: ATP-dependent Clp protease proteolytic subunit, partial [Candidatus Sulfotelmatobacter sp.]|nr:ATP-dependent Clp protease proteolytic subunit [Candidatus Sulfotelmatobacter sp.]